MKLKTISFVVSMRNSRSRLLREVERAITLLCKDSNVECELFQDMPGFSFNFYPDQSRLVNGVWKDKNFFERGLKRILAELDFDTLGVDLHPLPGGVYHAYFEQEKSSL